jgi:glutamate synthase (NADPH/NADH) large chain
MNSLYKESAEKDSCGFGLIANLDDQPSHWLVQTALASLNRLTHRGAVATDGKTGDGCGVSLKRPEKFLRAVASEAGIALAARFAAGIVFLNTEPGRRGSAAGGLAAAAHEPAGLRHPGAEDPAAHGTGLRQLPRAS